MAVATGLVVAKCRNQRHLLRAVDADATADTRRAIALLLGRRLDFGPTLAMARPLLFAMEGQAGREYVDGLKKLLPWGLGFDGRAPLGMRLLVIYDISDDGLRGHAAELLKDFGLRAAAGPVRRGAAIPYIAGQRLQPRRRAG